MEIRPMRDDERPQVLDLLESAFDERALFEKYMDHDARFRSADFLVVVEDGLPRSCAQIFEKRIRLAGETVLLGGIGSVATHPEFRGRGWAADLMRRQTQAMRQRGMAIGLLFAGPVPFYEKLGWFQIPLRQATVRRAEAGPEVGRVVREADGAQVWRLYDTYNATLSGTTVRDEAYWSGQLRYAGTPDETFRVAEHDGALVAYARSTQLGSRRFVMEYAHEPGHARTLGQLLSGLCAEPGGLLLRLAPDPELEPGLAEAGLEITRTDDPSTMWRVLDHATLARLAQLEESVNDRQVLEALVGGRRAHYWLSDRF